MTPLLFRKKVLDFYRKNGRRFPWRETTDPYRVLVSEIMLQQTQTHRVVPKYEAFLKAFPTLKSLAQAPLSAVLKLWQGLGYNRRALMLHRAAQAVFISSAGGKRKLPKTYEQLLDLPGIGPYTAGAVMVFAHNQPAVMIETNIRAALLHEFFPNSRKVDDAKLLPLLATAVPTKNPREFYQGLMDYGAFLKQKYPNPSRRSKHHVRQSAFAGSVREVRGAIIKALTREGELTEKALPFYGDVRFSPALSALVKEGLVQRQRQTYAISI